MSKENAPTLDGYVTADGVHVVVWCKHCRRLHSHGHGGKYAPLGAGDGNRAAHCGGSDVAYSGYHVREIGWFGSEAQERRYEREQKAASR